MTDTEVNSTALRHDGDFIALTRNLEGVQSRAQKLGVQLGYDIDAMPEGTRPYKRFEPMFAASLGKLPLAVLLARDDRFDPEMAVPIFTSDNREGAGAYDEAAMQKNGKRHDELKVDVTDLTIDMLHRSGNTAYRALARHYATITDHESAIADVMNAGYQEEGWRDTNVVHQVDSVEIGQTSPRDVLLQFDRMLGLADDAETGSVAETAWNALGSNDDKINGVRSFDLRPGTALVNKTGAYNGSREDQHVYRHDAGIIILPSDHMVRYAFMIKTKGVGPVHKAAALFVQDQVAGEIARYAGGNVPRFLGMRALL